MELGPVNVNYSAHILGYVCRVASFVVNVFDKHVVTKPAVILTPVRFTVATVHDRRALSSHEAATIASPGTERSS